MDPVLVLAETRIVVEPGGEARVTVKIRNPEDIVVQYGLTVLGPAAEWSSIDPPQPSVYRHGDLEVTVVFSPPPGPTTPSGDVPFGIRCQSLERPDSVAVVEGDLVIGATHELGAELLPQMSRGRWRGRHRVEFVNRGSATIRMRLAASDPANALSFAIAPETVEVTPNARAQALVKVRTRSPFLRGTPTQHRFHVTYNRVLTSPDDTATSGAIDGVFAQKPVLSKLVVAAAVLAIVGVGALVALAFLGNDETADDARALPPEIPLIRSVDAAGNQVQIAWEPQANATGYEVLLVRGEPGAADYVVDETAEVEAPQNAYAWKELAQGATHCFQLVAVNGEQASDASKPECKPTAPAAAVAPPQALTVVPTEGGTVEAAWQPSEGSTGTALVVDGEKKEPVPEGDTGATVEDLPPGTHCFSVLATEGEAETPPVSETCIPVANGDGSDPTTPSSGTGPGPSGTSEVTEAADPSVALVDDWIVRIGNQIPVDDVLATRLVQQDRAALEDRGIAVRVARRSALGLPIGDDAWLVFVDVSDEEEAEQFCEKIPELDCDSEQVR